MKRFFSVILLIFSLVITGCKKQIFNNLENDLSEFITEINKSNYLIMDLGVSINGQKETETIKAMNEPLYMEMSLGNEKGIITQEGNKVYEYYIDPYRNVERTYIGYLDNYNSEDNEENLDVEVVTSYNKDKCKISKVNGTYVVTCLYSDLLNEEAKEILDEMFRGMDSYLDALYKTVVTTKYIFSNNKLTMSISIEYDYEDVKLDMEMSYKIYSEEFTPINIFDGTYSVSNPRNFNEAYELDDINREVEIRNGWEGYYIVELERGMVVSSSEHVGFELYDMNQKLVSKSLGNTGNGSYIPLDSYMAVPEKGKYYLVVKNRISSQNRINLSFYPYDTVVKNEGINVGVISSYEGEIEGKYDFEKLVYNNTYYDEKTLRIENTGNETIAIHHNKKWYSMGIEFIKPGEAKFFTLDKGENELFICEDFLSKNSVDGYKYSVKFSLMDFDLGNNIVEEDIPEEFYLDAFNEITFYTYLEKGQYSILEKDGVSWHHSVQVFNKLGENMNANVFEYGEYLDEYACHFVIYEDAYYYVKINSDISAGMMMEFTKYDYKTVIDKQNPNILDVSGKPNNTGTIEGGYDFEYYIYENTTDETKVFELVNQAAERLYVAMRNYTGDNLMSDTIEPGNCIYFSVDPNSTRELTIFQNAFPKSDKKLDYCFSVNELVNNNVTNKFSKDIVELTDEYTENYYMVGYGLPSAYFKLNLKESGKLSFETIDVLGYKNYGGQFYLEDKSGRNIAYYDIVSAGEYFVRYTANDHVFYYSKIKYTLK